MPFPNMYEVLKIKNPPYLCQGDIFTRFEGFIIPPLDPEEIAFMVLNYDCDLINLKELNYICICPIYKINIIIENFLNQTIEKNPQKSKNNILNDLLGKLDALINNKKKFYFFLSPILEFDNSPAFADLLNLYNLPKDYIKDIFINRIKVLKHPWREKLGWKLSYIFNRIAIPEISKEKISNFVSGQEIIKDFLNDEEQ